MNIGVSLSGLVFEPVMNKPMQTLADKTGHFRLVTRPQNALSGSGRAEVISRNFQNSAFDDGISNLLKNSLNDVALIEHNPYVVKCQKCESVLSGDIPLTFKKIRPLPGANWEENANDLWFCHHPHPPKEHCHTSADPSSSIAVEITMSPPNTGTAVTEDLSNLRISQSPQRVSAYTEIRSPHKLACYYGPCYWAVNPINFPKVRTADPGDPSEASTVKSAFCSNCNLEVGLFRSDRCLILWDYGVVWIHGSKFTSSSESFGADTIDEKVEKNFKKAVFAALHEWAFNLTCKLLVNAVDLQESLFLWNIDRNLTVYEGSFDNNCNSNILSPMKVAKFMFCTISEGHPVDQSNPVNGKVFESGGSDHQITVPSIVLKKGIEIMQTSSIVYLPTLDTLKCGYLTFG
jgi:hypothetical protein